MSARIIPIIAAAGLFLGSTAVAFAQTTANLTGTEASRASHHPSRGG